MKLKDIVYVLCKSESEAIKMLASLDRRGYKWKVTESDLREHSNFQYATKGYGLIYKLDHDTKTVQFIRRKIKCHITYDDFKEIMRKENYVYDINLGFPKYTKMFNRDLINKIIINDTTVIVVLKNGKKGTAQCSDEDKFDEFKGFYIAYYRAIKDDINNDTLENIYWYLIKE